MNNPSIIEEKNITQQQELERLGLTEEDITKNKQLITKVDEKKANELGLKLVKLIGEKAYDEHNASKYDEVLKLIKDGANLNFETSKGNFPLLICARKGYIKTFITLLKFGADSHKVNKNDTSIVMSSARHGHQAILDISLLMGVDINAFAFDGDTALNSAKAHGQKICFETLVEHNAILNIKNYLNLTSYEIQNLDGPNNIDDAKYYAQVPTNPVILATHEDAMELIIDAKNRLCDITDVISLPSDSQNETPSQSGLTFESFDLPEEMKQDNINLNFKVK